MQTNHTLAILEQKSDAEIALAIHYLDPEFNAEAREEEDGTVLGIVMSSVRWLTGTLTYLSLYTRTL
jgi:hypothetical protein